MELEPNSQDWKWNELEPKLELEDIKRTNDVILRFWILFPLQKQIFLQQRINAPLLTLNQILN